MFRRLTALSMMLMMLTTLVPVPAGAQAGEYPQRPVTLIVTLPAGGPTDAAARTLATALSQALGQPFVVENRPGADGAIGARAVVEAAPDGYTLLFGVGSLVALPHLQSPPPFDALRDLAPVAAIGSYPFALFVHPSVPAANIAEFIEYARSRPEPLFYSASTPGEALAATAFMQATGVPLTRVPYKGSSQALPDLLAGRVQLTFGPVATGLPHVREGLLNALAVLTPKRLPALPDTATLEEAGIRGVTVPSWQAMLAPAGTPPAIIEKLASAMAAALETAPVRERLTKLLLQIELLPPAALAQRIEADDALWQRHFAATAAARQP